MSEQNNDGASMDPTLANTEQSEDIQASSQNESLVTPEVAPEAMALSDQQPELDIEQEQTAPLQLQSNEAPPPVQRNAHDYIYALGQLNIVFPNEGIKRQFLSVAMDLGVNEKAYYEVFTNKALPVTNPARGKYLYLAEQVDWVLHIDQQPRYVLMPTTPVELQQLIAALKPPSDTLEPIYTCVIGHVSAAQNDLALPEVICQQVYHHTLTDLHNTIQQISSAETNAIQDVIRELELKPNLGRNDYDRAKNFVAFRYPDIYVHTHKMLTGSNAIPNASLLRIAFTHFDSQSEHQLVDITLTYKENASPRHHYYFLRVDVSGLYPFINTEIQPFMPLQIMIASG